MSEDPGPSERPPSMYPTYDEWLKQQDLPLSTTPNPVDVKGININYRIYMKKDPKIRVDDDNHENYQQGRENVYGTISQGNQSWPRHGPAQWHDWFQSFYHLGQQSHQPFTNSNRFENIIGSYGYQLGTLIASGDAGQYDNQIWRVSKFIITGEGEDMSAEMVEFACKVVHIRNFDELSIREAGHQIFKEAKILLDINHDSIVKVFDNIFIEDSETKFPFILIASVMELMNGTVENLVEDSPNWVLPEEQCFWCLKDLSEGIDYLHNQIRSPVGQWMRVVHMAIRTANILYKTCDRSNGNKFKLADFEECIIYDRNFRPNLWNSDDPNSTPPDVLPDFDRRPYGLSISAPEIFYAREQGADRTQLRLMPNDVFCLCMAITFCRVSDMSTGEQRVNSAIDILENILNSDEQPPENSLENILMAMSHPDPNERLTIQGVLQHIYLNSDHQF